MMVKKVAGLASCGLSDELVYPVDELVRSSAGELLCLHQIVMTSYGTSAFAYFWRNKSRLSRRNRR
jgi:hypothetical protein